MHKPVKWEASRSGAGMTVTMTGPDGAQEKVHVKRIAAEQDGTITAFGVGTGDVDLTAGGKETSEEVASLAGALATIQGVEIENMDASCAADFAERVRKVATSALGQTL